MALTNPGNYGRTILAILLLAGLWLAYDAQAGIYQPGWLARFHPEVWCLTSLERPDGGQLVFSHYPGKSLARLLRDHGATPAQQQAILSLNATQKTQCYTDWQTAARANRVFQEIEAEFPTLVAGWTEAEFREALLTLSFGPVDRQADALRQHLRQQAAGQHTR